MTRIWPVLIGIFLMVIGAKTMQAQGEQESLPNVYHIQCNNRSLTGFLVKDISVGNEPVDGIVTALHGVADCESIEVTDAKWIELQLFAVDIDRDVALLVPNASSNPLQQQAGLTITQVMPENIVKDIYVVGHPYNRVDQVLTTMKFRSKGMLGIVIPAGGEFDVARTQLISRTSPSLEINVLDIQGALVPGYSGAPIFNDKNQVIGVANGGLKEGSTGFSWAIPWWDICWTAIGIDKDETCEKDPDDEQRRLNGLKGMAPEKVLSFVESRGVESSPGNVRLGIIINRTLLNLKEPPVLSTGTKKYLLPLPSELNLTDAKIIIFNQDTEPYETLATGQLGGTVTFLSSCGGDYEFRLMDQAGSLLLTVSLVSQPDIDNSPVILGCVYDSSTQQPITGAMVKVYDGLNLLDSRTTDSYGYYELANIHPRYIARSVSVTVEEARRYRSFSKTLTLNNRQPLIVDLEPLPIVSNGVTAGAYLRSGPGETFSIVASVSAGAPLIIIGRNKENTWYKLNDNTWISASLLDGIPKPNDIPIVQEVRAIPDIAPRVSKEVTEGAILRDSPEGNRIGSLDAGTELSIMGRNEANTWYQLAGGNYWISARLVEGAPSPDDIPIVGAAVAGLTS